MAMAREQFQKLQVTNHWNLAGGQTCKF